jgi:hypothetical protein
MSEAPTKAQPIAQRLRSDAAANRERILAAATIADEGSTRVSE